MTVARIVLPLLLLAACGENAGVNPPTEPAAAIDSPGTPAAPAAPSGSTAALLPGAGPTSFVGRWAADVSWCAAPSGANRPIEITPTRFEGYENSCTIGEVDQLEDGYRAALFCQSEGQARQERVKMAVSGQELTLTYLDRTGPSTKLLKCTTLNDTSTRAPALPAGPAD